MSKRSVKLPALERQASLSCGHFEPDGFRQTRLLRDGPVTLAGEWVRVAFAASDADATVVENLRRLASVAAPLFVDFRGIVPSKKALGALGRLADLRAVALETTADLDELAGLPFEVLLAADSGLDDRKLKALAGCDRLTHLDASNCPITDSGLKALAHLPLTVLQLGGTRVKSARLLSRFSGLRALDVSLLRLVGAGALAELTALEEVTALDCDDAVASALAGARRLSKLTLAQSKRLTDRGLGRLGLATALADIDLVDASRITDRGLRELGRGNVRRLNVGGSPKVRGDGFADGFAQLTSLRVARVGFSATGVSAILRLPALTDLALAGPTLSDALLGQLARATRLTRLTLEAPKLTNHALGRLPSTLDALIVYGGPGVTDAAVKLLSPLALRTLTLRNTGITVAGAKRLAKQHATAQLTVK